MRVLFVAKTEGEWHNGIRMYWAADRLGYDVEIMSISDPIRKIKETLERFQPDWAFVTGSRVDIAIYQVCKQYAKVCVWCADCVDEARLAQWQRLTGLIDCAFTPITALPEVLREYKITDNAVWMPQFWDHTYTKPTGHAKESEVCFLRTPGDSVRQRWEDQLSKSYRTNFSGGWRTRPDITDRSLWKSFYVVRGKDAGNAYAAAKISITIPRVNKWLGKGMEISDRIFNAIGCGSLFLQYDSPHLDRLFTVGEHFDTYDGSITGLKNKIDFYLNNEHARKEIAEAGQKYCLKHHTVDVRVKQYWEHLCTLPL